MRITRISCGVFFVVAGTLHFVFPRSYESVMPSYLPAHYELVLLSGAAEIVGGALVLAPGQRKIARWWLLGLLAAVFPANVYMATDTDQISGLVDVPQWLWWARLPLQGAVAAWVWAATRPLK